MACKCIQKIQKELEKRHGSEIILTNTVLMVNIKTGKDRSGLEPLRYKYYPKKQDGTLSRRLQSSFVAFTYCPFCRKRYKK